MTADSPDGDKRHGDTTGKSPTDPARQGAKPGAFAEAPSSWTFLGGLDEDAIRDDMSALLAQNWWAMALRGVFAILFGIIALLLPGVTLASLTLLFAAYMLVDGIFAIVAGVRAARQHERWGWLMVEGVADLVAGAIAIIWPLITIVAFVLLMAAWAVVSGALLCAAALRLNLAHGRWLMGLGGLVSVIWGILLVLWPLTGAVVLTWWMGAYALFFGGSLLGLSIRLYRRRQERLPAT